VNGWGRLMDSVSECMVDEWMRWVNGCVGECMGRMVEWVIGCMIG